MDFNKTIGPGKNNRLINVGPMFVLFQNKEQGRNKNQNTMETLPCRYIQDFFRKTRKQKA